MGVRHEDARKNMTCWPPFSRQRNKASGQSLRLQWRTFAADMHGGAFTKNSNRRNDVRHYRLSIRDLLDFAGLSSNLAYITSVFIGYIGTDSIGSLIKRFAAKKAGVEDGRNQRKAFLDMLAWSEGTDNGRQKTRNHGYDVIVGGELFTDYSDHPQTCHAKPKTQINRRRTLPASFLLVGCLPQAVWPERLLSEKSGRCGIAAD